jgi:nucleoside-diphosphate-sugar epimerase
MRGNGQPGARGRAARQHVLVTGGAGYVGSVLVQELLPRGHSVRVLDALLHGEASLLSAWGHPTFEFMHGDVRDPDTVSSAVAGVDSVVHLAAIVGDPACQREPELAEQTNVEATSALLDAASAAGVGRFVFLSTCSNYGKMANPDAYVTEESELRPVSLYAETKVAAERDVISRCSPTFETCVLRLATVYGVSPRMRFDLTVNQFTRDMRLERPLVVYGVEYWRPYIHVRDAANALCSVIEAEAATVAGNVFNAGATAENYRKADLLRLLEPRFPAADVEVVEGTGEDPRDYRVSFEKIRRGLGFSPSYNVTDGIEEVSALVGSNLISDPDSPRYTN